MQRLCREVLKLFSALAVVGMVCACVDSGNPSGNWQPSEVIPLPDGKYGDPTRTLTTPPDNAHWTKQLAYKIDGLEADPSYNKLPIVTKSSAHNLTLNDAEPFAFQWHDTSHFGEQTSFTVQKNGWATITRVDRSAESEHHRCLLVQFKLRATEVNLLRRSIQASGLAGASGSYSRDNVLDGTQWRLLLRVGETTKEVDFSNAFPEPFRDLVVHVLHNICAAHADEIDASPLVDAYVPPPILAD